MCIVRKYNAFASSLPKFTFSIFTASVIGALALAVPTAQGRSAAAPGAVASENLVVSQTAIEVLKRGGNAIDAAISAALSAGVASPSSSGLGGGAFAVVHRAGERTPMILDFREEAPERVDAAALERRPLPWNERGHLVGVPGEARGLWELSRRFGKLPWAELTKPAERRARLGFPVNAHLARALGSSELAQEPSLAALFFPKGRAALAGSLIKNPKLARTLQRLGAEGPAAIYDGVIASEIVATVASAGGTLALSDLAQYRAKERTPIKVQWEGYEIFTMPPPSAGGLLVAQTFGSLTKQELNNLGYQSGALSHWLAEHFRASLVDRFREVGDPEVVNVDVAALTEPARLAARKRRIALDRTHSLPLLSQEEHGTHHLVVTDTAGNVISLTTTVNRGFGAKLVTPQTGIVLNDQLDDFTLRRDADALGATRYPNAPRPRARPTSSMTPTIVLRDGKPVLALGGSGGMTISSNVTQLLVGRLGFSKTPEELLSAPRFFVPYRGPFTLMLEDTSAPNLREDLARRGERVSTMPPGGSAVQIIAWDGDKPSAAADPRKFGSALTTAP